jgi:hypothetical protein
VVVLGTSLGAMVQEGGGFTIRNVPVGIYRVRADLAEHEDSILTDVRVTAGDTTNLEIRLRAIRMVIYKWAPCGPSPGYRPEVEDHELSGDGRNRIRVALGLTPPVDIESWGNHADGGSISMTLRDSCGTALRISWDGAMRIVPVAGAAAQGPSPTEPRLLYFGAPFSSPGARPIPLGSPQETALLDIFRLWADEHVPAGLQDSLLSIEYDYSTPTQERERRLAGLDAEVRRALAVSHLLRFLESQRTAALGGRDRDQR